MQKSNISSTYSSAFSRLTICRHQSEVSSSTERHGGFSSTPETLAATPQQHADRWCDQRGSADGDVDKSGFAPSEWQQLQGYQTEERPLVSGISFMLRHVGEMSSSVVVFYEGLNFKDLKKRQKCENVHVCLRKSVQ